MTNKETRKWAFEQATRLFRNGEVKATLEFAEKIYEFVNKEDCCAKTPTKENCKNTIENMDWVGRGTLATNEAFNSGGVLKHLDTPLTPKECYKPASEKESETMSFDTLEDLMNFIIKSEEK